MSKVQQIELITTDSEVHLDALFESSKLASIFPKAFVEGIRCQKSDVIELHSLEMSEAQLSRLAKVLRINGVVSASLVPEPVQLGFEVEGLKSQQSEALSNLVELYLTTEGVKVENFSIRLKRRVYINLPSPSEHANKFQTILNALAQLESRSPLYDRSRERIRLFVDGQATGYYQEHRGRELPAIRQDLLADSLRSGSLMTMRLNQEFKVKRPSQTMDIRSSVAAIQGYGEQTLPCEALQKNFEVLVSLPKRSTASLYDWSSIEREVEKLTLFLDKDPTMLGLRSGYSRNAKVSLLPVTSPLFKLPRSTHLAESLYYLGPWNSQNPLHLRILENLFEVNPDLITASLMCSGNEDWLSLLSLFLMNNEGGISICESSLKKLIRDNHFRLSTERALLIATSKKEAEKLQSTLILNGLSLSCLGQFTKTDKIECLPSPKKSLFSVLKKDLSEVWQTRLGTKETLTWDVPELKSTTFGYDRALIFPDQYMLKITFLPSMKRPFQKILWSRRVSSRSLAVQMRKPENSYIQSNVMRYKQSKMLSSWSSVRRTLDIDPEKSGVLAVDVALREHLCSGSMLQGLSLDAIVSLPTPSWSSAPSEEKKRIQLALSGVSKACKAYGVNFVGESLESSTDINEESFVMLRLRSLEEVGDSAIPFKGFRMDGEEVFCLGSKPAFVEAGSRILNHVRVFSNYMMEIDFKANLALYSGLAKMFRDDPFNCMYSVPQGGVAEALFEMAIWGGRGILLKPMLSAIDLFSGAPSRVVVSVKPHQIERLESLVNNEKLLHVGTTGGQKVLGLELDEILKGRNST